MAYRTGDRTQMDMFPPSYDKCVSQDDPVRAYDAFIDALDFNELGIEIAPCKVGNSSYHPKAMLKLLVYGPSYGWRSSRNLERATYHNIAFMWLMGGMRPDHKTIAEFRRINKKAIRNVLKLCCSMCCQLGLISGNILFTDSTKVRANAARARNYTHAWYKQNEALLDRRIEQLLEACDQKDAEETGQESFVKMDKELRDSGKLREKIRCAIETFKDRGTKTTDGKERSVNLTDPESALMRSVQGSHASYNVQSVVDDTNGLIAHIDAVSESEDSNQLARQTHAAERNTGTACSVSCADAGYANVDEQETVAQGGTTVIVPSQRQALHEEALPFSKRAFRYNREEDCYYCPAGKRLTYLKKNTVASCYEYRIERAADCLRCCHYGTCTQAKAGRKITRMFKEESKEHFEHIYAQEDNQRIYARRKQRVEHPFGHIKRNLKFSSFLMRGLLGAQAEISIAATCFNIARMITIYGGVRGFIRQLQALPA